MFHGSDGAIGIGTGLLAAGEGELLQEIAATDVVSLHLQGEIFKKIGSEFDVAFAGTEERIEPIVWLAGANFTALAKVAGQRFTDQNAALADVLFEQAGRSNL